MNTIDRLPESLIDARYLFLIWFVIALTSVLIILAGIIGIDVIRDWRLFNQLEKTTKPTPKPRF